VEATVDGDLVAEAKRTTLDLDAPQAPLPGGSDGGDEALPLAGEPPLPDLLRVRAEAQTGGWSLHREARGGPAGFRESQRLTEEPRSA
jgi:hypothetical protein